ncbi:hypothetical protein ACN6AT_23345 [Streptomyces sp. JL4002]|uniref:hypothetical protein n=1 Tax=Streptomyces TaxID=1883 RepID=UPI003B280E62
MPRLVRAGAVDAGHAPAVPLTDELAAVLVIQVGPDLSAPVGQEQFRSCRVDASPAWAVAAATAT